MNHTIYFNDDPLYRTFCQYGKSVHGSVSKANSEAMRLWLKQHQGWSSTLKNIPHQKDSFRFEDARKDMRFQSREVL